MDELKPCKECGSSAKRFINRINDHVDFGLICAGRDCWNTIIDTTFRKEPTKKEWERIEKEWDKLNRRNADGTAK